MGVRNDCIGVRNVCLGAENKVNEKEDFLTYCFVVCNYAWRKHYLHTNEQTVSKSETQSSIKLSI